MSETAFAPTTIVDQPVPLLDGSLSQPTGSASNPIADSGAGSPDTINNVRVPQLNIASDVVSTSLNTATKAILGTYTFEQLGAIQINSLVNPAANIKISGDGIVGTDLNGVTSFAISSIDGSATFRGTVTATDFIGGTIAIGSGNTIFKVDSAGNMWVGNASMGSAPFQVTNAGAVTASNVTINGGSININGNFIVDTSGNLVAHAVSLAGTLSVSNGNLTIDSFGDIQSTNGVLVMYAIGLPGGAGFNTDGSISATGSLYMNGHTINSIDVADFQQRSGRPGNQNCIYFWKNGGSYGFRSNMQNGTTWQFNQSS